MDIITNNKPRELISWFDLTKKEQSYFDWLDEPEEYGNNFFRYKDHVYSLEEFMRVDKHSPFYPLGYNGYLSQCYSSGLLIKLDDTGESIIVALYY